MQHVPHRRNLRVGDASVSAQAIRPLTGFGWDWRADGVILTLLMDGKPIRVFMPLLSVWDHVAQQLQAVGCPVAMGVGAPQTVRSLFEEIHRAATRGINMTVSGPVEDLAQTLANVINTQYASQPIIKGSRPAVDAAFAAINQHLSRLGDNAAERAALAQEIANVLNLVLDMQGHKNDPIGSHFRAYIDGAFANVLIPMVNKTHRPSSGGVLGAISRAAQGVVHAAASAGKGIVNSKIVRYGLDAAALAMPILAPAAAGLEAAHQALKYVDDGVAAAKQIKNGLHTTANAAKVALALNTQHALAQVVQDAKSGSAAAQRTVGAFQQLALARAAAAAPNPHTFMATVLRQSPQMAVHQGALLQIADAAQAAKMHALRPYRVRQRAA